jgi:hypothetical protein
MAFDKPTRNRLAKFVSDARGVIADEFTEQFQSLYGISAKGDIAPLDRLGHLDEAGMATAALLRERIDYLEKTHPDDKDGTRAAVSRLAREQAFTILNRLAAIRMAEKRGLIVESVGKGYQSKGFKVFETVAGSALGDTFHRYRRYLFCLFDELAIDLGILFDRRSPQALLFPREPALLALLDLLHAADLEALWAEDETIGWIYQYYNDPEERKKMRAESAAPRNSRELAVRNQFFTPRYVVEFLTDNTLGRIWYEMTKGDTRLSEQCRYLVRRPTELFLKENEIAALPLSFDEELPKIIGDPREAYRKVYLQEEEENYTKPWGWVGEAFRGELANLLPDSEDPDTRWVGAAISPEMIDTIIGERWQPFEDGTKLSRLTHSIYEGNPHPETRKLPVAWAILSAFARTSQHAGGYERPYWEKLWSFFRSLAVHWSQHGPVREEDLSQEELLKQPVFIPHRPLKDPRGIRLLDPACGSMHFGLYAFDLFETIYKESWDKGSCPALQEAYASKEDFIRDVPRLIIEHNIHGIDIDPRATQIAALSLWLRAQKAWQQQNVPAADRPRVRRSNIVCAEPMPGSPEMLEEFVATLNSPLIGELVKTVFDKMQLAGEAGSLLKIEKEIRTAIDTARKEWLKQQDDLLTRKDGSQEEFFDTAEQQVIDALRAYSEQADADSYQRRLFADDAARGFAFIDLCRKRYDAVVMNPPFGDTPSTTKSYFASEYPDSKHDVYAAFVEAMTLKCSVRGRVGAITARTGLFLTTFAKWRSRVLLRENSLKTMIDLGYGVLDGAMVETAAYVLEHAPQKSNASAYFFRLIDDTDKELFFANGASEFSSIYTFIRDPQQLLSLPTAEFAYWVENSILSLFSHFPSIEPSAARVKQGIATGDNFRFLRSPWEIGYCEKYSFRTYGKGGDFAKYFSDLDLLVSWDKDGQEIKARAAQEYGSASRTVKNTETFGLPGFTYTLVTTSGFSCRCLPSNSIYDMTGPAIFPTDSSGNSRYALLAYLNSSAVQSILSLITDSRHWHVISLQRVPIPEFSPASLLRLAQLAEKAVKARQSIYSQDETANVFRAVGPTLISSDRAISNQDLALATLGSLAQIEEEIEDLVAQLLNIDLASVHLQTEFFANDHRSISGVIANTFTTPGSPLISFLVGATFGRWDIRYATGERQPPELPDPFDPLPVCPPGMLQNTEGLPAEPKDVPAEYPLRIFWPGILVDDENHREDIVARVRQAIEVIWKDRAEVIEQEACEILGLKSLREYFGKPAKFFSDHLKRYSKSRRQAPIYWPLSTRSGSYTLWLYYHRLTDQTLHTCLADFLDPKIRKVQSELDSLTGSGGGGSRVGDLRELLDELRDLRDEIDRVIKLPWKPNLNDGVLITASPLWKLFRLPKWQKDLKDCWGKLAKGEYDWAHLAHTIWPQRVEKACEKDRSVAIAHGLERLCKVQPPKAKKRGKKAVENDEDDRAAETRLNPSGALRELDLAKQESDS